MYIPEAVATCDSIPKIIKIGQNIIPPPMPQNADMNAPNQAIPIKRDKSYTFIFKSPGTNLYPHACFSLYSYLIWKIACAKKNKQEQCKKIKRWNSKSWNCLFNNDTVIKIAIIPQFKNIFVH